MHDLATIRRRNEAAHAQAIRRARARGAWVVVVYAGLTLLEHSEHASEAAARSAAQARGREASERIEVLPPLGDVDLALLGGRDQSEDRPVSFATVDDYLRHVGRAA